MQDHQTPKTPTPAHVRNTRLADAGQLRVPVADVLPLEELAAAFALSREGHVRGKLVISVSD
jgi:NADPH:quinone reductase-like Zn-dependent oxidoreductase